MRLAGVLGALALLVAAPVFAAADVPAPTKPGAALRAAELPTCPYEWPPVGGLQEPIAAGRYDEIERVLLDVVRGYEENRACESRMLLPFQQGFYATTDELREQFDRWVAARKSWMAYTVRGLYWVDEAHRRRGSGLARDLTEEQSRSFRDGAQRALADFERALALNPKAVVAYGGQMRAYKALGDTDEVERVWRRASAVDPASLHLHDQAANAFEPWWGGELAQVGAVVEHARRHVQENPSLIRAYGYRDAHEARHLDYRGERKGPEVLARQLALYNSALRYGEATSQWHAWRAHAYVENRLYDHALREAAWALAVDPKHTSFWVIRIRSLMGANRLDEALAATRAAQQEIDHHWFPWYEGGTLRRMHRYPEAAARLRAAADHPAATPQARGQYLTELGEVLVLAERPAEAEAPLREAVELRPDYAPAWLALGDALWDLGRRADAKPALRKYLALTRDDPDQSATRAHVAKELAEAR